MIHKKQDPLEKYYSKWLENSIFSAEYCIEKKDLVKAEAYIKSANFWLKKCKQNANRS